MSVALIGLPPVANPPARNDAGETAGSATPSGGRPARGATSPNVADSDEASRADIVHALNRLGYGPRPGEVERIAAQGLDAWIEAQLNPATIADPEVERRLAPYPTLTAPPHRLLIESPPSVLLGATARALQRAHGWSPEQVATALPAAAEVVALRGAQGDDRRAVVEAQRKARESRTPLEKARVRARGPNRVLDELAEAKMIRAVYSERQLEQVMVDFWFNHFNVFAAKGAVKWWLADYERNAIRPHALGNFRDLLHATARHPAMLFYLDNWTSVREGAPQRRIPLARPTRQALQQLGLPPSGVVGELLRAHDIDADAIDRAMRLRREREERRWSRAGRDRFARRGRPGRPTPEPRRERGLNENYARELLELHTLGVDGGYTQQDIVEVARCFTGWTLLPLEAGQGFVYVDDLHEPGKKTVLGKRVRGKGQREGREVLDRLARHPATARFVSHKLAVRFVSDQPPAGLVDAMAAAFRKSDGDIAAVLRTMFDHPRFWAPETRHAKIKTPFEYVASLARATGATLNHNPVLLETAADVGGWPVDDPRSQAARTRDFPGRNRPPRLARFVRDLGQPSYFAVPPTGWGDTAEDWVSSGGLLQRMKLALSMATDRVPGVHVPLPDGGTWDDRDPAASSTRLATRLLGAAPDDVLSNALRELDPRPEELEALDVPPSLLERPGARARLTMGWVLASPTFQRR